MSSSPRRSATGKIRSHVVGRRGFSLVELLVVVAIVGTLAAMLLPAVQAARETSRRNDCLSRLRQLGAAMHNFESAEGHFPAGAQARPDPADPQTPHTFYRWSAFAQALPYLEHSSLLAGLDLDLPLYDKTFAVPQQNRAAVRQIVPVMLCPSDRADRANPMFGPTNYAACAGSGADGGSPIDADGAFFINSEKRPADITDGMSRTVWLAETIIGETPPPLTPRSQADPNFVYVFATAAPLVQAGCDASSLWNFTDPPSFAWANGEYRSSLYNHWRAPNSREFDCVAAKLLGPISDRYAAYGWRTSRSMHPGGVNAATADGGARFYGDAIDPAVWRAIATRNGDETLDE